MTQDEVLTRISTGISGLNEILHGGLVRERSYLVRGGPGTGKTTMGMHFLAAGAAAGEAVLWISLGESETKLRQNATAQEFDLQGVTFLDLSPSAEFFSEVETYDIFAPADVDREPTTQKIIDKVKALKPKRVFVDSMTQFRYLSADALQFRKQACPSGVGKTTIGLQFIKEMAGRGLNAAVYTFKEGVETLINRCEQIHIPVRAMNERDTLTLNQIEPLRYTPDKFAHLVRQEIRERQQQVVMLSTSSHLYCDGVRSQCVC